MSSPLAQAWKRAERSIATDLSEAGIPAERVCRANNWSKSDTDIHLNPPLDFLKVDSKYSRSTRFRSNSLLKTIEAKYCLEKRDEPVLVTRNYKESGVAVTIRLPFFIELLKVYRDGLRDGRRAREK